MITNLTSITVNENGAICIAVMAIHKSKWIQVVPLPFNNFDVLMRDENKAWLEAYLPQYPPYPEINA